jgi:hypothetical protein
MVHQNKNYTGHKELCKYDRNFSKAVRDIRIHYKVANELSTHVR